MVSRMTTLHEEKPAPMSTLIQSPAQLHDHDEEHDEDEDPCPEQKVLTDISRQF